MRQRSNAWHPIVLGAALALTTPAARADEPARPSYPTCARLPTDAERAAARGAFVAGRVAFGERDWATALAYWNDAYRRDCTAHALLLDVARAHELLGDAARADEALATFLARRPDDPLADEARRRREALRRTEVPARPEPLASSPEAEAHAPARVAPFVIAGAGGLLAIVGAWLSIDGHAAIGRADAACPDRASCADADARSDGNSGRDRLRLGEALVGSGVALAAGGLVWHFAARGDGARASVVALARPDLGGVALGATF